MITVIAKQGTKCPKEGNPRKYITDSAPVEVPGTAYYRRLVKDGSLRIAESTPVKNQRSQKKPISSTAQQLNRSTA